MKDVIIMIRLSDYKKGVEELRDEHFSFIEKEFGITAEEIFRFDDDELDEKVYEPLCEIEIEEIPRTDEEEESERCRLASEIVTILGNSFAEANGLIEVEELSE